MDVVNNNNATTVQNSTIIPQQQQQNTKKKRKCRGNRKKQRHRRQLYAQGLNSETVEKLVEEKFHAQRQQEQQNPGNQEISNELDIGNIEVYIPLDRITLSQINHLTSDHGMDTGIKRKRDMLTPTAPTTPTLDQSLSQLSIAKGGSKQQQQQQSKKKKARTSTRTTNKQTLQNQNNQASNNPMEKFKPRYLKVSDRIFKQILSNTAIENGHRIFQCLNTPEKLRLVRELTETTNDYYHKDLQRQLWQEYYELGLNEGTWGSIVSKNFAHKHHTCRIYGRSKSSIERHQAAITHELQNIKTKLDQYKQQLNISIKEWEPSIDLYTLSSAINECVKRSQKRLKEEFDFKKEILMLDSKDHQCLKKFYNLQPNNELIQLAIEIWQATANELKTKQLIENLRQRIYLKRLPINIDKTINQLLDDNEETLSNPFCDQDQHANLTSRCSKTIIQCKINLMLIQLDEYEIIMRRHHSILNSFKEKLFNFHKENPTICTYLLMNAIEERRQIMIKRFNRIHQHNLKTFFDEAPMVDSSNQ